MVAVKVQYTVKAEYVEDNKRNIQTVMESLKDHPIEGMYYSSYTDAADPHTFIHINICKDAETMAKLSQREKFQIFRSALKASGPISPPKRTDLNLVGAAFDI